MTKFSGIPPNAAPALADYLLGVTSGNVDDRVTIQNLLALLFNNVPANTIKSPALALSAALDSTNGLKSFTNTGTAGGTGYYINLGGIKILFGVSGNSWSLAAGTNTTSQTVIFPSGFFSGINYFTAAQTTLGGDGRQMAFPAAAPSTSSMTVTAQSWTTGSTTSGLFTYLVIGT